MMKKRILKEDNKRKKDNCDNLDDNKREQMKKRTTKEKRKCKINLMAMKNNSKENMRKKERGYP